MYFKQLDSLRAIAVTMVFLFHWLPSCDFFQQFRIGPHGVGIFFVLSGFLITRILIEYKLKIIDNKLTIKKAITKFYIRRAIRIFPIYYLLIIFLFLLGFENIRNEVWWHVLYASNLLFTINGEFSSGLSHLWSLSVEEQFYIIWPTVIFLIPIKRLKKFFVFSILIGIATSLLLTISIPKGSLLVFSRIDAFSWGGLLAYIFVFKKNLNLISQKFKWIVYPALTIFIFLHVIDLGVLNNLSSNILSLLCFFLISKLIIGYKGIIGVFFENKLMVYVGKISYGIYLYHNFMQWLIPYFAKKLNIPFPTKEEELLRFLIYLIITLIAASLSYELIEKQLNKLKKHF